MTALTDAIREVYVQVHAPDWAAPNLDALADVLRDLSWLPPGPVDVRLPAEQGLDAHDALRLERLLRRTAAETAAGRHPLRLFTDGELD